ncbi:MULTISPECIES: hypothetical protein [Paracoccaceae]|uniref:hypothetical protein n=2 Tax=Paracoccaceae TaxID=31989 RepID=UPI00080087E9|nr:MULTISPECIES: hypothetical protein [Paracoccaceae]MCL7404746.1 hypothetical protein [Marivivens geojensis]NRP66550.1 hypothetical protein [Aliiroseovarius sp. xm-v-225]OBR35569.1 hypothetical protein A9199_11075 [Donghicola sp. JL3646]APO85638.1 hypothetical protein BSK21_00475 [Marivivens sp. JLT3646]NRP42389.1 hypothetical protein [Aliiroseovarius sp. xm-m-339-2]
MASKRNTSLMVAAIVALAFGALTVLSGGRALFGSAEAQAAVGNAVPFVLWFNFLAGFAYILAGIGLFLRHSPAVWISIGIFASTALVALAFAVHMMQGGAFEMRTVGAMILRTGVWAGISVIAWRHIRQAQVT